MGKLAGIILNARAASVSTVIAAIRGAWKRAKHAPVQGLSGRVSICPTRSRIRTRRCLVPAVATATAKVTANCSMATLAPWPRNASAAIASTAFAAAIFATRRAWLVPWRSMGLRTVRVNPFRMAPIPKTNAPPIGHVTAPACAPLDSPLIYLLAPEIVGRRCSKCRRIPCSIALAFGRSRRQFNGLLTLLRRLIEAVLGECLIFRRLRRGPAV